MVMRATPASGGTYQYSLSMLEALGHISGYDITLYADTSNSDLARFKFPVRHFVEERPAQFRDLALDALGIRRADPFAEEDILIAPTFSPALLHTAKPFVYTLHDLQEYYYPANFSWTQRAFRRRVLRGVFELFDDLLARFERLVRFLEIVVDVHAELALRQVADVAHRRDNLEVAAEIFVDGLRLRRRLDHDE